MKLFGYLPDGLFRPLAGPNRHIYARLLLHLHDRVFAARMLETPTRDDVLRHIAIALPDAVAATGTELQEDDTAAEGNVQAHYVAYYRLRDNGWLVEEREKWRTYVDMSPDAFMLLGTISELANTRLRVAGAVVDVKNNLEAAAESPEEMSQGLANAHETAVRFARGMRRVLVSMRDVEDRILGNPDAGAILRTFFEDFVNGLLIADYKQLKTSNNPYRFRRHISALAGDLVHDTDKRAAIARAYIKEGVVPAGSTIVAAEERVVTELDKIRQVFEDVGAFMERIESFRDRLERRVRTTIHYMDMIGEGSIERIARLIEELAAQGGEEVQLDLRTPDTGFPITAKALYVSPAPRSAPEKTRFRVPRPDPYLQLFADAKSGFDRMVRVTRARLLQFIDAEMAGREVVTSSEIKVDGIEDLFAFRHLPSSVGPGGSAVVGDYRIVLEEEGRTGNEWIDVPAFRIERLQKSEAARC